MVEMGRFRDRADAGRVLADELAALLDGPDAASPLVLALPRGGVPVAAPIAARLGSDLDVLAVRKIGAPHHHELAIGAVASGGLLVLNHDVIDQLGIPAKAVEQRASIARRELADQERRLGGADAERPSLAGRTVMVVDDGLATGATMRAAVKAARTAGPGRLVVAVPVGPPDTCAAVGALADDLVCPLRPHGFGAVGQWYRDFSATTDEDVLRLLAEARRRCDER